VEGTSVQHPLSVSWPPLLNLSQRSVLLLDSWLPLLSSMAFWLIAALVVGLLANHLPASWLERPGGQPTRHGPSPPVQLSAAPAPRASGPLGIRVWKRWIPDAGGALPGGVTKASLVRRDPQSLRRLVLETRRAELVHWLLLPSGLLTALWLMPPGVVVNVVFALAFNLPCLLLQRYNRARLQRCLGRSRPCAPRGAAEGRG
jgi:glycosyl-4,4'-diaponeurosporenoate acyltransferase